MNSNIKQKDLMIKLLEVLFPAATIYLFGSRARGTHREFSNIDISVDTGKEESHYDIARAKRVLEALYIPEKIDVVDFQSIPIHMQKEIIEEGIIWKKKKD